MGWTHWRLEINFKSTSLCSCTETFFRAIVLQCHWKQAASLKHLTPLNALTLKHICQQMNPNNQPLRAPYQTQSHQQNNSTSKVQFHWSCCITVVVVDWIEKLKLHLLQEGNNLLISIAFWQQWRCECVHQRLGICVTIKYQKKNNFPTHPNKRQLFEVRF